MCEKTLDKMMRMSVDEIIAEYSDSNLDHFFERVKRPLTAYETALLFQSEGVLTVDEIDVLMYNKIQEIWEDENSNK